MTCRRTVAHKPWFRDGVSPRVERLLIHEFAHHFVDSHYNSEPCDEVPSGMFYEACCVVGERLKGLALEKPEMFRDLLTGS